MKLCPLIPLLIFWMSVFSKGKGLDCYICDLSKSWDECNSKSKQYNCPEDMQVCYKTHRVEMQNEKEIHHYQKGCGVQRFCTGEECKKQGQWCDIHCCNTDACNEAIVWNANCMTCIMLALLTASYLL